MSAGAIADRYAQALFELGTESGALVQLSEKLSDFAQTYEESRELRAALTNPTLSAEEKSAVLSAVAQKLGVPVLGVQGLLVMAARGRLPVLSATIRRLMELSDEKNLVLRAEITTALAMPESFFEALSSQLAGTTGKKVRLERKLDPDLLGGSVLRVGDLVIDGSVHGQLEKFERELLSVTMALAS